jgi:uncharacterized membrane protein YfcA
MTLIIGLILVGVFAGALSGLIGIGGGIIIVPALIFLFHFSQKEAQGTTLALLIPPLGLFAAMAYYKAGFVDVKAAVLIIAGFVIGSLISSHYAVGLSNVVVAKVFGVFLLLVAIKMLLTK